MKRFTLLFSVLLFARCGSTSSNPGPGTPDASVEEDANVPDEDGSVTPVTCPKVGKPKTSGEVAAAAVDETSGIAVSSINDKTYWLHNDSGDSARAFAVTDTGTLRATVNFDTVKPNDIEDMAIEDAGSVSYLYFGDIGDNAVARKSLTIHRVTEPKLGSGEATLDVTSEKMTVTYVDGPHNAETLLFDPTEKALLIATKVPGGPSAIHRIGKFVAGGKAVTEKIAEVAIDLATGGEISRDGSLIAIRNYSNEGFLWRRAKGQDLAAALAAKPCKVPIGVEAQGETFAFLTDGSGYVTVSEGVNPALHVALFE